VLIIGFFPIFGRSYNLQLFIYSILYIDLHGFMSFLSSLTFYIPVFNFINFDFNISIDELDLPASGETSIYFQSTYCH